MAKIVVLEFLSLDGVMQAPGGKGEDPSGGFDLEGWTFPHFDEAGGKEMDKQITPPFDLLLGRKTYDIFAGYWPQRETPFNDSIKYVVSNNTVNTDWKKTIQIKGDVASEIRKLKEKEGPMMQVYGSSEMVQMLLANDLVDELWLKFFPVVLGKGKRLFGEGAIPAGFKLIESKTTPSGVIFASYKRNGDVETGTFGD